jgi:hypothetical protein
MSDDPFAPDETPADPWPETSSANDAKEAPVTQPETEVSATLKAGTGYDAPWLVARGPNAAAVVAELRSWFGEGGLIDATARTAEAFKRATGNDKPAASQQRQPQPAATPPPGMEPKKCKHGAMVFRSGTSKKGNPYKVWSCPSTDQDDQCRGIFVK